MKHVSNISVLKSVLWLILWASFAIEMTLFPSLPNLVGGLLTMLSTFLYFRFILNIETIRRRLISFIALLYPFLFMYLPLPVTLLDGNEMSHDLINPISTYMWQFLFFSCTLLAFYLADRWSLHSHGIYRLLKWCGYYVPPTNMQLWIMGALGLLVKIYIVSNQYGEEVQSGLGSLSMFSILLYSPICILFRPLLDGTECSKSMKMLVWYYIGFLMIFLISTNSRSQMIAPLVIMCFGYFITTLYKRSNWLVLSFKKVLIGIVAALIIAGPLTDMGFAMLLVRSQRADLSFGQLLNASIEVFMDREQLHANQRMMEMMAKTEKGMDVDWDEYYVSNLYLNRLCNYRVVDATLYHASLVGYSNPVMLETFFNSLTIMFPAPIMRLLFGDIDKSKYFYSSMDKLYNINTGREAEGYRVGGDVGLGLATFGFSYFPLMIFIFTMVFIIFNSVARYVGKTPVIPYLTIILVYFQYFLKFQVANGIISQTTYILWGFWFSIFCYLLIYKIIRMFSWGR